jgi:zinc transporter 1
MDNSIIENNNNQQKKQKKCCKCCKLTKTASLIIIIIMTGSFFLVELVVGHLTKSNSLVADAFHMLSDLIALIIGLTAVRISKRKSSNRNTFGWARAEILGSLVNSVFLLALCFTIIVEAINRYLKPEPLEKVELMLGVGAGGLALNIIALFIFFIQQRQENKENEEKEELTSTAHDDDPEMKTKKKKKEKKPTNMNMQAVFLNALGDSLGSVAVVISGCLVKFAPPENDATVQWKLYIDPTLSLIIAMIITVSTVPLLKKSSMILLETVPENCNIEELRDVVRSVKGVVNVHHFHIWSLNSDKLYASAHVRVTGHVNEIEDWKTINAVKKVLHDNKIHSTTIQLEHDDASLDSCEGAGCKPRSIVVKNETEGSSEKVQGNEGIIALQVDDKINDLEEVTYSVKRY